MTLRDVAITGRGVVTPPDSGVERAWAALFAGQPAGGRRQALGATRAADDYSPLARIPESVAKALDRGSLISLDAALQALESAGLGAGAGDARRFAVVDGLAYRAPGQPVLFAAYGQMIARVLGVKGPVLEVAGREASGAAAIVTGWRLVANGEVDVAVVGAGQALQAPLLAHLRAEGIVTSTGVRPFDRLHAGLLPAEGAAFLVLEAGEQAAARGRADAIRLEGAAQYFDPKAGPLAVVAAAEAGRGQQLALAAAGIVQNQVDVIVSCADGRPTVDRTEGHAIRRVFGNHAHYVALTAVAGALGQTLAASGPLSVAMACELLSRGLLFPVAGFEEGERDLPLAYVVRSAESLFERALVTSLGLGGSGAAFVVRRHNA